MLVGRKGRRALGAQLLCVVLGLWGCAESAVGKEPFDGVSEPGTSSDEDAGEKGNDSDPSTGGGDTAGNGGAANGGGSDASNGAASGGTSGVEPDAGTSGSSVPDAGSDVDAATSGCAPGTSPCGDLCVDLKSSAANCGSCGHACPGGQACNGAGACLAPAGCSFATYGSHDYFYCTSSKKWQDARNDCTSWGMDLAVVETADENNFLKTYPGWIALNDITNEGTYLWVAFGGVNNGPSAPYTNWDPDEPNNDTSCGFLCTYSQGEDCAEIYADGLWNDARCDRTRAYLCETY